MALDYDKMPFFIAIRRLQNGAYEEFFVNNSGLDICKFMVMSGYMLTVDEETTSGKSNEGNYISLKNKSFCLIGCFDDWDSDWLTQMELRLELFDGRKLKFYYYRPRRHVFGIPYEIPIVNFKGRAISLSPVFVSEEEKVAFCDRYDS